MEYLKKIISLHSLILNYDTFPLIDLNSLLKTIFGKTDENLSCCWVK